MRPYLDLGPGNVPMQAESLWQSALELCDRLQGAGGDVRADIPWASCIDCLLSIKSSQMFTRLLNVRVQSCLFNSPSLLGLKLETHSGEGKL